jgi:predicted Holliday junction resolvase-like endonuclease
MTIVLIISFIVITLSLYIYFSIKSKDLSIKILDEQEAKKVFENLLTNTQENLVKAKQELETKENLLKHFSDGNKEALKKYETLKEKNVELEATFDSKIKEAVEKARADSIKRQRSILKGQATEQLAPYINSNYNPKDYKFMGDPIDYIIFDGMSDINTKEDKIKKIILMDIKTGRSQLNKVQKAVKKCIEAGNIEFQVYRPEKDIENNRPTNEDIQPSK